MNESAQRFDAIAIGGGPAGLTAALELARHGRRALVLEASDQVGGISRTVMRDGWRFDLGGHRFFTKVRRVEDFWRSVLPPEDFQLRPRLSRIYYRGRFFDYPLRATNAIRNLGPWEATLCVASYFGARLMPPTDQSNFEGWVAARFGWRLYRTFFKTYTEKVWGVPAHDIQADWAAQRIKNLSLGMAILDALGLRGRKAPAITSLVEQFHYPRLGPGMMWERCAEQALRAGQEIRLASTVTRIRRDDSDELTVHTRNGDAFRARNVISSMPIRDLVEVLDPPASSEALAAARKLRHRDFLTVALVVPRDTAFPDNWIYVHAPEVRVSRIQNFGAWSPDMVKPGATCLGLEYYVNAGDDLWSLEDPALISLATKEVETLGLVGSARVADGYVVRVKGAYPVYDSGYAEAVSEIRAFLEQSWPSIHPVGRNGMHRYNNQDHSMLTAMLTVDNLVLGTAHDIWTVNVEHDYHESVRGGVSGTGRSAPVIRGD